MSHNTDYKGELQITEPAPVLVEHLRHLNTLLSLTPSDKPSDGVTPPPEYPALKLTPAFTALKWSGDEKTYGMDKVLNWLTAEMRKKFSEFQLSGGFSWTDDYGDSGVVKIDPVTGMAEEIRIDPLDAIREVQGLEKYKAAWEAFARAAEDCDKYKWRDLQPFFDKLAEALLA